MTSAPAITAIEDTPDIWASLIGWNTEDDVLCCTKRVALPLTIGLGYQPEQQSRSLSHTDRHGKLCIAKQDRNKYKQIRRQHKARLVSSMRAIMAEIKAADRALDRPAWRGQRMASRKKVRFSASAAWGCPTEPQRSSVLLS